MIAVWVLLVNKVRSAAAESPKPLLFLVKLIRRLLKLIFPDRIPLIYGCSQR